MTDIDIRYIAGFFDGEGYVGVKGGNNLSVTLTNNHKGILESIQRKFYGVLTAPRLYGVKLGKEAWVLSFYGKHAKLFLEAVCPYLVVKKDQARLALTYPLKEKGEFLTEEMKQTRQFIMDQLKEMKQEYKDANPENWESTRKELEDSPKVQKAIELYTAGMETKDVAEELGAKVATVSYWLRTLKVNRSRKEVAKRSSLVRKDRIATRPDAQKAVELFDEGLSIAEIANQLDKKYATVYNWLRKLGRTRTLSEAQKIRRQNETEIKKDSETLEHAVKTVTEFHTADEVIAAYKAQNEGGIKSLPNTPKIDFTTTTKPELVKWEKGITIERREGGNNAGS